MFRSSLCVEVGTVSWEGGSTASLVLVEASPPILLQLNKFKSGSSVQAASLSADAMKTLSQSAALLIGVLLLTSICTSEAGRGGRRTGSLGKPIWVDSGFPSSVCLEGAALLAASRA